MRTLPAHFSFSIQKFLKKVSGRAGYSGLRRAAPAAFSPPPQGEPAQRAFLLYRTQFSIKQKKPLTENYVLSGANSYKIYDTIRGATLIHGMTRALSGIPAYPRHIYACLQRRRILCERSHLTAPSAVHLTTCFSSGSQHPGLSVKA